MIKAAHLRAARAYLHWTMDQTAAAAGIHRRTLIRLEGEAGYAARQPTSFWRVVAAYRTQCIVFEQDGFTIAVKPVVAL